MKRCVCLSLLLLGLVCSTGAPATPKPSPTTTVSATTSTNPMASPDATATGTTTGGTGNNSSTTQPAPGTTASPVPTTASITTASPTTGSSEQTATGTASNATTEGSVTDSSNSSTESPTTTTTATPTISTATPAVVTPTPVPTTTAPNSTAVVTSTPVPTTVSPTIAAPSSTSTPVATNVVISETNLLLASKDFFVELKGSANQSLSGLTLVIFNATSATETLRVDFDDTKTFPDSGFFQQTINSTEDSEMQKLQTVLIALYKTEDYNSSLPTEKTQDFVLFSSNSSAAVNTGFQEAFLPNEKSVTLVKSGLNTSQSLSLSRCGPDDAQKDASMFVLTPPSEGKNNICHLTMPNSTMWTLALYRKNDVCKSEMMDDIQERNRVENHLVALINQRCQCGLTTLLVEVVGNLTCSRNLYMDFKIKESFQGQADMVISAFVSLANSNVTFMMDNEEYRVLNCTTNCSKYIPLPPPGRSSKDGTTVTVAVVLSCLGVFLVILLAVILYMRGRRRGIIRQFRMTRLQEDDDMDDMDDFIGSGGEASFSTRHR